MKKQIILLTTTLFMGVAAKAQVGIGTETPSATLDIVAETGSTKSLEINNSTGIETVTVLDNGNVGVNMVTPVEKVDVKGAISFSEQALANKTAAGTIDYGVGGGAPDARVRILSWGPDATTNGIISFLTGQAGNPTFERMRIHSNGNVGIGTINPTKKLEINAGSDYLRITNLASVSSDTPVNSLVIDPVTGDVGQRNSSSISAVKVVGYVGSVVNNVQAYIDDPAPGGVSVERFDNLNEFSGHTFTATATGLYQVHFVTNFPIPDSIMDDDGDGYMGQSRIFLNGVILSEPGGTTSVPPLKDISLPPASEGRVTQVYPSLLKLNAGDTLDFAVNIVGSTAGPGTGKIIAYSVQIARID